MARFQKGSLRQERRKNGKMWWVLRFYVSKAGRRVEHTTPVGLVSEIPTELAARQEIDRQQLDRAINQPEFQGPVTVGELAAHFVDHELSDQEDAVIAKSHSTVSGYRRNIAKYILPRWGKEPAMAIQPRDVEDWLKSLKRTNHLANPTVDKQRRLMNLIFKSGQRYGLLPRHEEANPMRFVRCRVKSEYEAIAITPRQAWEIWSHLPEPESTLVLLAAVTGLRASECLGLQWRDVDFAGQLIHVRRVWTGGRVGEPKSKSSRAAVPLHPVLAAHMQSWRDESPYSSEADWVFPSFRLKGKKPRVGNMLIEDYIRPAAEKVGIVKSGEVTRFGLHTLRHSLASYLVQQGKNPTTVKELMRHSDVQTTLNLYSHGRSEDRMAAQGDMLSAFFAPSGTVQ